MMIKIFRNWKTNSLITTKMKISSQSKPISKILSMCKNDQNQQITEIKLYKLILWLILYLNKLQHNVNKIYLAPTRFSQKQKTLIHSNAASWHGCCEWI